MAKTQAPNEQASKLKEELESIGESEKALKRRITRIEAQLEAKELSERVKKLHEAATKTYLTLWYNSEGKTPAHIMMKLQDIGFKPSMGKHDLVFDWRQEIGLDEISKLGNAVHKTLKGLRVLYRLETF